MDEAKAKLIACMNQTRFVFFPIPSHLIIYGSQELKFRCYGPLDGNLVRLLTIKGLGLHSISEVGFRAAHNGEGAFTIGG